MFSNIMANDIIPVKVFAKSNNEIFINTFPDLLEMFFLWMNTGININACGMKK